MEHTSQSAWDIANQLRSTIIQRYWIERPVGVNVQGVLRQAAEHAGLEYKYVSLTDCFPMDLEDILRSLPDRPGVIVLDEYDKSDKFLVGLVDFMLLYYEYRKMITLGSAGSIPVSVKWKFVLITEPRAWIPSPELHKLLYKL
jgi:hypothetical protein